MKSMNRVVVKLSGSLFRETLNIDEIQRYANLFTKISSKKIQLIVVAGGGEVARRYIDVGRRLGADEASLDQIGIAVSRLNAGLLISSLKDLAYPHIPEDLDQVAQAVQSERIVVTGGLHPGHSTNATAALIAEKIRAELFINATDVDGVYSADPRFHKKARKLRRISVSRLIDLVKKREMQAGSYELIDLVALKVIERSSIPTVILKCDPDSIEKAVEGRRVGTFVSSSR